jgi:hypothetical protein
MFWMFELAYFFAGAFLLNSIPHLVSGLMGRAFQSPFANPPGEGLSSSLVNVLWGWLNALVGYVLIFHVGDFDVRTWVNVLPVVAGGLLISIFSARHFGRFHGGLIGKNESPSDAA